VEAVGGFEVHAGVTIRAGDRAGLEQLCRYTARETAAATRATAHRPGGAARRTARAIHLPRVARVGARP
jgi:hypothetical protein